MLIGICSTIALAAYAKQQRGYCTASGDISSSDHFTIKSKFSDHCYKISGKDRIERDFCVSPTTPTNWAPGTYFEYADYELRNGYADFTVPGASFKKWENEEAFNESRQ